MRAKVLYRLAVSAGTGNGWMDGCMGMFLAGRGHSQVVEAACNRYTMQQ